MTVSVQSQQDERTLPSEICSDSLLDGCDSNHFFESPNMVAG